MPFSFIGGGNIMLYRVCSSAWNEGWPENKFLGKLKISHWFKWHNGGPNILWHFFMKKRHQMSIYKQFSDLLVFFINNIKIHSFTSLTGLGALQGNFGRYRCAAEIAKTPQCIYCYQMKPEFACYNLFDNLDAIG